MRDLPLDDPGVADHRSAGRLLWWLAKGQWHTLLLGMLFGIVWMSAQAVMPAVIGRAIDQGVAAKDSSRLVTWAGRAARDRARPGGGRHHPAPVRRHQLADRGVPHRAGRRAATRFGSARTLPRKVSTGEVVSIGTSDLAHVGNRST